MLGTASDAQRHVALGHTHGGVSLRKLVSRALTMCTEASFPYEYLAEFKQTWSGRCVLTATASHTAKIHRAAYHTSRHEQLLGTTIEYCCVSNDQLDKRS